MKSNNEVKKNNLSIKHCANNDNITGYKKRKVLSTEKLK